MALSRTLTEVGGTASGDTSTGRSIGTASADRWVVLAFTANGTSTGTITIGGITATKVVDVSLGATIGLAWANVPTGTTATIIVNNGGNGFAVHGIWAITGSASINKVAHNFNVSLATASLSINVGAGGTVVGPCIDAAGGSPTLTWTAGLTNDTTQYSVSGVPGRDGSALTASTTSLTCTFTGASSPASWLVSFEPAATAQVAATEAADTASMRASVVSVSARLNTTEAADVASMRADVATTAPFAIDGSVRAVRPSSGSASYVMNLTTTYANDIIFLTTINRSQTVVSVVGATIGAFTRQGGTSDVEVWAGFAASPLSSEAVTITTTGNNDNVFDLFGVSGSGQTSLTGALETCTTGTAFTGSYTTTHADTLLFAYSGYGIVSPTTPGTGFTALTTGNNTLNQYKVSTSTGTFTLDSQDAGLCYAWAAQAVIKTTGGAPSPITGYLAATEAPDTASMRADVVSVSARLNATEAADTASMRADVVSVSARLNATEAADTAAMRADVVSVSARLFTTEAPDTAALNALAAGSAVMIYTEAPDTASMRAIVEWNAQLNATEAPDVAAIRAYLDGTAQLNASEAPDIAAFNATVSVSFIEAQLTATEAPDTASLRANTHIMAQLAATEAPDTASMAARVEWNARLGAVEAPDVAALRAGIAWNAPLAATEAPDTAALRATASWEAVLGAIEAGDIAVMRANAAATAQLAATENPDVVSLRANLTLAAVTARANAVESPDGAQIRAEVPIYSPNEQPGAPGVLTFGRRVTISRW